MRRGSDSDSSWLSSAGRGLQLPPFDLNNPGVVLRQKELPVASQPAALEGPPTPSPIPMSRLVEEYVAGKREEYMAHGWRAFKNAKYREACDYFGLAEAVSTGEPQAQVEAKLAVFFAGIASSRYAVAANALRWLLDNDPHTGQMRDPQVLSRFKDMEGFYGSKDDYAEHVRRVEQLGSAGTDTEVQALRAVVLWGRNDRARAMFCVRDLADPKVPEPWPKLPGLMRAAMQGGDRVPTTTPAAGLSALTGSER